LREVGDCDFWGANKSLTTEDTGLHRGTQGLMTPLLRSGTSVSFAVRVHPRAKRSGITGKLGDALKVSLTVPPIDGRANKACIEFFAKLLKVPRTSVTIASGQSSRNKVIRVIGLSAEEVGKRLQA
jgi:uncharacterized protein